MSKIPPLVTALLAAAVGLVAFRGAEAQSLHPPNRPVEFSDQTLNEPAPPAPRNTGSLVPLAPARPPPLPSSLMPPDTRPDERMRATGDRLCGLGTVEGRSLAPISDRGECGIDRPVEITRIAGVVLDPAPIISCTTAAALEDWITSVAQPFFRRAGRPLEGLQIAASYVCRNVNFAKEGDLSQHAFGGAIDISRFRFREGELSVRNDWSEGRTGALLRDIYDGACGIFGTTLGPDADRYHEDHFHFDVAERNTPYCR